MPEGREYEVKFSIAPGDAERLLEHPILRANSADRRCRRLVSTYFDTPDALLRRKGVSLRVRQSDAGTTHTLKGPGTSLVDRAEWEHDDSGSKPDAGWLRSTPLRAVFKNEVHRALDPRFTVEVSRTTVPISFAGGTIEGALDQGVIRARNVALPIDEFELELKAGEDSSVLALARALARDVPLVLTFATKAERGYGVVDLSWGRPTKDIALDLHATRTLGEAFSVIVQACLDAVCRNAALIGNPDTEVEAVHKTRIALRRLRAIFGLFRPVLRRKRFRSIDVELKRMSNKLGAARDADVFQQGTFDPAGQADDPPGSALVADMMRDLQHRAHDDLHRALKERRWRMLLLDVLAFSTSGVRRRKRQIPCARFVRRRLGDLRRALVRRTRRWSDHTVEEMHDIRKRAKTLRYDIDLVGTLPKLGLKRRVLKRVGEDLQTMQQSLGEVHDRVALRNRVGEVILRRNTPPGTGTGAEAWASVRHAALQMVGSSPQDNTALHGAHKAAKRMRRSTL